MIVYTQLITVNNYDVFQNKKKIVTKNLINLFGVSRID